MEKIKYISKEDMKKSDKEWKWIYVVKQESDQKYKRDWQAKKWFGIIFNHYHSLRTEVIF